MKRAPRSLQHHVLYRKYNGQDSEISALLGKCGFKIHSLPEHMAAGLGRAHYQLVGILALLALFTHENIFWVAALILAVVQIPDVLTPVRSIADSLDSIKRTVAHAEEASSVSPAAAEASQVAKGGNDHA